MALKKLCGRSGCSQIIDYSLTYCDKHQREFEEKQKQRHKEYKQRRDDKKEQAFYSSDEWVRTRDYVKAKYHGLCLWSYYVDREIVFCESVHHIEELKEAWEKRLEVDNLIPLSETVHQKVHRLMRENGKNEKVKMVLRELKRKWEEAFVEDNGLSG
ncbi:conserved hypothetical protein [Desulfitobacterium hafniense DCB-2]|uniref:HNH endonuclease n=1 Tax=Desulfitobacterium hafniense (strain DSM 10664 / DCB-2) TaxID=272564 RepID=B8FNY1_DESHD|nr:hypothetical protein [Desulfitobacterium hafniense]ACL19506.1 conserved hypothetical protein [Desulfitobacterium hafniense DCB-2]